MKKVGLFFISLTDFFLTTEENYLRFFFLELIRLFPYILHNIIAVSESKYSVCCHLKVNVDSMVTAINSDWSIKPE